jgi:hypothetical protein
VIVTRLAASFTDSFNPVLYRVELGSGGRLLDQGAVETVPLSGEFRFVPGEFNANGIEATPDSKWLSVVNSPLGTHYRVDPDTGEAPEIDLGGECLERHRAKTLVGLLTRLAAKIAAYTCAQKINDSLGRSLRHLAELLV